MAWMWVVCAVLVVAPALWYLARLWNQNVRIPLKEWKKLGVPGPPPKHFWGNAKELEKIGEVKAAREWSKKYGKVCGYYVGRKKFLLVTSAEMLKEIMVKEFDTFTDRQFMNSSSLDGAGRGIPPGLLLLRGDRWRQIRHIVSHTFTSKKLKLMVPQIEVSCNSLVDKLGEIADSGKSACIWTVCGLFTMETILAAAFGRQVNVLKGEANDLTRAAAWIFEFLTKVEKKGRLKFSALLSYFPWLKWVAKRVATKASLAVSYQKIVDTAYALLQARKKMDTPPKDKDFLQLMLEAHADEDEPVDAEGDSGLKPSNFKKKTLTDTEIVGVASEFLLAAYETTSNTLGFTAYCMALNTHKQDKLCEEIDNYYSEHPDSSLYDASQNIPYVEWVINETLRMYPPAARTIRYCKKTIDINGITIPKGTIVQVAIETIHYDPEYYDDPNSYIPERFSPEEKACRNPMTHLPFGWGPRQCVGKRFAMMEMKMALVNCFRKYKFARAPETQVPIKVNVGFTLGPTDAVILKVVPRD